MKQDEIIAMAREAGFDWHTGWTLDDEEPNRFETLIKLATAKEREACAKECERTVMYPNAEQESAAHQNVWEAAKAIRAREAT